MLEPTDEMKRAAARAINNAGWTAEYGEHEPGCFCEDCEKVCAPIAEAALRAALAAAPAQDWRLDPPEGWFVFGTHAGQDIPLKFWGEGEDGLPIWERPTPEKGLEK